MEKIEVKYSNFAKVIDNISKQSPFQRKAVSRLIEQADQHFFGFAEDFVTRMLQAVDRGECHDYLATAYLNYTKSIRVEEMFFAKENKYRYSNYDEVYQKVYSRDDYMFDYVVGLGMTQLFWPNHWDIVNYFITEFLPLVKDAEVGAEVGVGHGLFHSELLKGAPNLKTKMLDVSKTSLNMTQRMLEASGISSERAEPVLGDVQLGIPLADRSLDVLLMGELIEHIQHGKEVLLNFSKKMKTGAKCFFTTACNAPAEDHILLFTKIDDIHQILSETNWKIIKEHFGTLNKMSVKEAEDGGHNINYAAVLTVD